MISKIKEKTGCASVLLLSFVKSESKICEVFCSSFEKLLLKFATSKIINL